MGAGEYKRIPVPEHVYDQLSEYKRAKESWAECFLRLLEDGGGDVTQDVTSELDAIHGRLDDIEAQLPRKVAEELQR